MRRATQSGGRRAPEAEAWLRDSDRWLHRKGSGDHDGRELAHDRYLGQKLNLLYSDVVPIKHSEARAAHYPLKLSQRHLVESGFHFLIMLRPILSVASPHGHDSLL